jgi:hypothetical protein
MFDFDPDGGSGDVSDVGIYFNVDTADLLRIF